MLDVIGLISAPVPWEAHGAVKTLPTRFHALLAEMAGNAVMAELIGRLWDQTRAMCIRPDAKTAILDARVEEHARITEAVAEGNGDAAEAETRLHIRRIAEEVYSL